MEWVKKVIGVVKTTSTRGSASVVLTLAVSVSVLQKSQHLTTLEHCSVEDLATLGDTDALQC